MVFIQKFFFTILVIFTLLSSGCGLVDSYDYRLLKENKPRSIVVIPPQNNTVAINAPYIFLSTISKPLAEKGYYVFPVAVIDHFMKENGLPTPAEMNHVPLDKIREHIGADAVLYTTIENWGQKYRIVSSTTMVESSLSLVDARTGDLLWEGTAYAEHKPGDQNGGLLNALITAVTEQIIGSMSDRTPALSRHANQQVIYQRDRGLLPGPYRNKP